METQRGSRRSDEADKAKGFSSANVEINYEKVIGRGSFGVIFEGVLKVGNKATVAVKQYNFSMSAPQIELVSLELGRLQVILPLNRNLLKMEGFFIKGGTLTVVHESCNAGNLEQYMNKNFVNSTKALKIMERCASALEFLHAHNPPIVHKNIKPTNILLHRLPNKLRIKLADCGCVYNGCGSTFGLQSTMYSRAFMPPEAFCADGDFTPAYDVFALGIVFLTIINFKAFDGRLIAFADPADTGSLSFTPIAEFMNDNPDCDVVPPGAETTSLDNHVTQAVKELICDMTKAQPDDRINIGAVYTKLNNIYETVSREVVLDSYPGPLMGRPSEPDDMQVVAVRPAEEFQLTVPRAQLETGGREPAGAEGGTGGLQMEAVGGAGEPHATRSFPKPRETERKKRKATRRRREEAQRTRQDSEDESNGGGHYDMRLFQAALLHHMSSCGYSGLIPEMVRRPPPPPCQDDEEELTDQDSDLDMDDQLRKGHVVRVCDNTTRMMFHQRGHGEWTPRLAEYAGKSGYVHRVFKQKISVRFPTGELFALNPCLLTRCDGDDVINEDWSHLKFKRFDVVKMKESLLIVELTSLQEKHGGWNEKIARFRHRRGVVQEVTASGDPTVEFPGPEGSEQFTINASSLDLMNGSQEDLREGDVVLIDPDREKVKALQKDIMRWTSKMEQCLGSVGFVLSRRGHARVEVAVDEDVIHIWHRRCLRLFTTRDEVYQMEAGRENPFAFED